MQNLVLEFLGKGLNMTIEHCTIRYEINPRLSNDVILDLSSILLDLHDNGVRNAWVKTDLYKYSFRHRVSRCYDIFEGGMVHEYDGFIYSSEEPLGYNLGFKLIEGINQNLN